MNNHETQMLRFLYRDRRARARYLLQKKRAEFTALLHHPGLFDPDYLHKLEPRLQTPEGIVGSLRARSSVENGYLISSDPDLDQKVMPVAAALEFVVSSGLGTFVSVLPGRLGYLETENAGERFTVY